MNIGTMKTTILLLFCMAAPCAAQTSSVEYPVLGRIAERHASEIRESNWSIGTETMDRDYTLYDNWKEHLGPLGIKKARIQAGWAKTEREKGKYDWAWLDAIIDDMVSQGVEPWINVSYGNAVYSGGGGTLLGAKIPATPEALQGWDNWVRTMVRRYKDRVDEWEIWNEPNGKNPATAYATLLTRTARVIREEQAEAKILAMAIAGIHPEFADSVLAAVKAQGGLALIDEVTYHPYTRNPDSNYDEVEALRKVAASYDPRITIRQGENGAPSEFRRKRALNSYNWSELSQAKWALRRMLGDLGRDIPSSYFAMTDMLYPDEMNRKGLLYTNDDKQVLRRKPAYGAVQHLAAVFDDSLERVKGFEWSASSDSSISAFAYKKADGRSVVTLWFDGSVPSDSYVRTATDLAFPKTQFTDPVYVDLRDGTVYDIPDGAWKREGGGSRFTGIPLYDSPILIAERSALPITTTAAGS